MKIIVFGATGQTGSAVLKLGTECEDLEISAFVRSPTKISSDVGKKLAKILTGNVMDENDVSKALEGQDAVISCLGVPVLNRTPLVSQGTKNIVNGMRENGVKKLVLVGSGAFLPTMTGFFYTKIMHKIPAVQDHQLNMRFLRTVKDVDWTIAMAPWIRPATHVGHYKTAINKIPGAKQVTTLDLADWMLSYVQHDDITKEYAHQFVGISSATEVSSFPMGKVVAFGLLASLITLIWYYM